MSRNFATITHNLCLDDAMTHIHQTFQTISSGRWMLFWLLCGITIRLASIIVSGWRIDFDEAFNGLLAFDIIRGDWVLFTPPEVVGGTGSAYILAGLFAILGSSATTFRVLSLIWSGVYIITTGWLAKTAYGERVSILAMGFASLAPPYMLIVGMKIWSSYIETILLGNLLFLATYHLLQNQSTRQNIGWMIVCGLLAGVMFWLTWLGFYYFLPVSMILLWRGRPILYRWGWVGLIAFLAGSLPFWIFNIPQGILTFTRFTSDTAMNIEQIGRVLIDFITTRFPIVVSGHPSWGYDALGLAIMLTILNAIGLWFVIRQLKSTHPLRSMLAIFVISVPVFYVMSTNSRNALPDFNPWGIDATGRYILMLHSILPIGLALIIHRIWQSKRGIAFAMFVSILGINSIGALSINHERAFDSPYYDRLPRDLNPLLDFLDAREIQYAWVDGGIGHVLMFLTEERILTEDYRSVFLADGLLRKPENLSKIQSASPTVFITPIYAGQQHPSLQQALDNTTIPYEMVRVTPTLVIYIIDAPFDPLQIAGGLGYQY